MKVNNKGFSLTTNVLLIIASVIILIFIFITYRGIINKIDGIGTVNCTTEECKKRNEGSIRSNTEVIFRDNVANVKDAAINYFTTSRLPKKVGDKVTLTLKKMIDDKLVLDVYDEEGNVCDSSKSYVEVTKYTDEYIMKIYLSCTNKQDYILVHLGCYEYCSGTVCEKDPEYEYEYAKSISCKYSDFGPWSNWSTTKVTQTDLRKVETRTETKEVSKTETISAIVNKTFSCPENYTLDGEKCYKKTSDVEVIDAIVKKEYSCEDGYDYVEGKCSKIIETIETINASKGTVSSCPDDYDLVDNKCEKTVTKTETIAAKEDITYTCPDNTYTLNNTTHKCSKEVTDTVAAKSNTTYSCPDDTYTLNDTTHKCSKEVTDTVDAKAVYSTKTTTEEYDCDVEVCSTKNVRDCSSGSCVVVPQRSCHYEPGTCTKEVKSYYVSGYKCEDSTYTLNSSTKKCTKKTTKTINATAKVNYSCADSTYTLNTTTKECTKKNTKTVDATANKNYSCTKEYTLTKDNKCTRDVPSKEYVDPTVKIDYTCKEGYELVNTNKCTRSKQDIEYSDVITTDKYTCKEGYKLNKDNKCERTNENTDTVPATSKTTYSCAKGYTLNDDKCSRDVIVKQNITYYRYATRTCTGGRTDKVWSEANDKELLAEGYKMTGKKRLIGGESAK